MRKIYYIYDFKAQRKWKGQKDKILTTKAYSTFRFGCHDFVFVSNVFSNESIATINILFTKKKKQQKSW